MDNGTPSVDAMIAAARNADAAGDANAALVAWMSVRSKFPDVPEGYIGLAEALRQSNQTTEAEATLMEARTRFPTDPAIAEHHAWLAHKSGRWAAAHVRWVEFRKRFPDALIGYAADGVALRCLRRFEEAEAVYREVFKRWPKIADFDLFAEYAELAQASGDIDKGSQRWAALRTRFPDRSHSYLRDAAHLSSAGRHEQAEALLAQAVARWPEEPTAFIEYALSAQRRGDTAARLKRWGAVLKSFPQRIEGYLGAADALYALNRAADAENVLRPALQRFPDSAPLAELHARIAFARDDFSESRQRWTACRQRFPSRPAGWSGGVNCALALSNYEEAEALSAHARETFPADLDIATAWSSVPEHIKDWPEAARRWAAVCTQFPQTLHLKSRYVVALLQNKEWQRAEQMLKSALKEHPDHLGLIRSYAECATEIGDWDEAEARWREVLRRFPDAPGGWNGYGDMLRRAGRLGPSAALLATALKKFPGDENLEQSLAWTWAFQRDWPKALRMWEHLSRRFPQRPGIVAGTTFAIAQAKQELAMAAGDGRPAPFELPASLIQWQEAPGSADEGLKELFMGFESLGDTCEFGMVQRRYGAEPLGLLRWATTAPGDLTAAIEDRLAGVGNRENTVIESHEGEYITWDTRYGMRSHTFIPDTAEPLDTFTARHLRRMQYLRRKLLEDLEAGEKIFVYKCDAGLFMSDVKALHAALRRYNPRNALLCALLADGTHPVGRLESIADGCFLGYLDRFSTVDINVDLWVAFCRKVREARDRGR